MRGERMTQAVITISEDGARRIKDIMREEQAETLSVRIAAAPG